MKRAAIFLTLLLPVILLLGLGYVVNGRVAAKPQLVDVGGIITTDTTWTAANSPYIITDTVIVQAGVTLTIEAGVTVMIEWGSGEHIEVEGHLEVAGTAVNPVLITSSGDLPSNHWLGINVTSGSAHFVHTTLRHAETPLFIFSEVGGDVMLENSTIEENSVYPIFVTSEALHRLKMNNVSFSNNVPNRIAIELNSGPGVMATLSGDVLLTPQPGLEAYEIIEGAGTFTVLNVPQGITLSLAAGTVVLSDNVIMVDGRIEANGTELEPVIFEDGFGPDKYYLFFAETGSASLVHTTIQHAGNVGIGMGGQSNELVILQDVLLTDIEGYPIVVEAWALHRLQMTNVTFQNNTYNRVVVDTDGGQDEIAADVTLTAQPGLTWYEFADGSTPQTLPEEFVVPEGVTLTVEPGVQLRFGNGAETLVVNGRLQASGTPTQPITFTSKADSAPGQWEGIILQGGSSQLENVVVRNGRENILIGTLDPAATVQIAHSAITHSSQTPLGIQTANLHQTDLTNITFANNAGGENIVLYGEATLGGAAVLNDQPGLDAYVVLDGNLSHWFVVPPTATLSINPGVTLKFNESGGDFGLRVEGELHTAGTQAEPVILTSQTDSAPGQWNGILLDGGSTNLNHTIIRYSKEALLVGALDANDSAQLNNTVLQASATSPLGIPANLLHQLALNNVTFSDNQNGNHIIVYENGTLAGDVTLSAQPGLAGFVFLNSPTSQLVVPDGVTLTLNQGVTLKFMGSTQKLRVQGHLETVGTSLQPAILTSFADSAANQWSGIVVENGTAQLDHAEVRYASYNLTVNNTAVSTPVILQNSQLHSAALDGLLVADGAVTAVCSRFTNNNGSGVFVLNTGQPTVQIGSSALVSNGAAGLTNQNASAVDARQNWWGDPSGPAGIGPGSGSALLGNALFDPWLEEDTCTTVPYQLYLPFVVTP